MAASFLSACGRQSYTVGTDVRLDEITSVYAGGSGMTIDSQWSYGIYKDEDKYSMTRVWWDEKKNKMREETAQIDRYEYEEILYSLEGYKYKKYKADTKVMDGETESVRIVWPRDPNGSYRMDFGEDGMYRVVNAMSLVWGNYGYAFEDPIEIEQIQEFSIGYGPEDIYEGRQVFEARLEDGKVIALYKPMGKRMEDAYTKEADPSLLSEIKRLMEETGANRWDGFQGHSMALDGSSFSMTVTGSDGKSISAYGHMSYPDGFRNFWEQIEGLFTAAFGGELPGGDF